MGRLGNEPHGGRRARSDFRLAVGLELLGGPQKGGPQAVGHQDPGCRGEVSAGDRKPGSLASGVCLKPRERLWSLGEGGEDVAQGGESSQAAQTLLWAEASISPPIR